MSWQVGSVRITKVPQMTWHIPLTGLVPEATAAACAEAAPGLLGDDGMTDLSLHSYVVESDGRRILIDTCAGDDPVAASTLTMLQESGYTTTEFPVTRDAVAAAGWAPEDIDLVLCTHLHFDHIGGNVVDGAAAFPSARYLVAGDEWGYWSTHPEDAQYPAVAHAVAPLIEAGAVDLVDGDHALTEAVRLVPTPGHTPGHVSVLVEGESDRAVITGDFVHHPVEMVVPAWRNPIDTDHDRSVATRQAFVERFGDGETLLLGTHFGGTSAGRFDASAGTWTPA